MDKEKKVLLIAGGGTLGTYVAEELLKKGCLVDVICLEEKVSHSKKLQFFRESATEEFLIEFLSDKCYDGIVNFMHYPDIEKYKPIHRLLTKKCSHLIFLSSYRVYGDSSGVITEETPMLLDTSVDERFLSEETYALSKAKGEKFLRTEDKEGNWTIVRPVISFADRRLDIVTHSGNTLINAVMNDEVVKLPVQAQNLTAGLDWAGNTGRIIANILFKDEAIGEAYTISSAQNLTWGEIAEYYTEILGAKFSWIDTEEFIESTPQVKKEPWMLLYDRLYDRHIDNSKVLKLTGMKAEDFLPIKEGIKIEYNKIKERQKTNESNTCK